MVKVAGFEPARKTKFRRLVVGAEAMEKAGKTEFALSAPQAIAIMNMDVGLEGVVDKHVGKKEIVIAELSYKAAKEQLDLERIKAEALKVWTDAKKRYAAALASPQVRTIVQDTSTEMWELARLAAFGKLADVKPHHYGPVNAEFRDMIRAIYDTDKNMVLLFKMKEQYINDKSTGKMVRSGFTDAPYLTQVNVRLWRQDDTINERGAKRTVSTFGMTVLDCRQNPAIIGEQLEGEMSNFATLASLVYPETEPGDWR